MRALKRDAVGEKSHAVGTFVHAVVSFSHGGLFLQRAALPKIDAT